MSHDPMCPLSFTAQVSTDVIDVHVGREPP
jgi:hypothetical protein